ncbi:MAG: hypothetical protein KKB50_12965 [Planctomycetes bacterium]|nr:hypothetical protein [Planctomycetota bacterium]
MPAKHVLRAQALLLVTLGVLAGSSANAEPVVFARHLSLSPAGQTLAFSWAGDIWTVSIAGGAARRLTVHPGHDSRPVWLRDGRRLAFTSNHDGGNKLYTISWNGQDQKRILASEVGALRWDLTGGKLFYLKGGVPNSCTAEGSDAKAHAYQAKLVIDLPAEAAQKFDDAARALGRGFYHPTMKGLDWPALTAQYRALALETRTVNEFNEVFNMLLGELNASHLGIHGGAPRDSRTSEDVGYLGCEFDADHPGPGLKVTAVTPQSPADRKESKLVPGDTIVTVNRQPVGPDSPLDQALIDTVGEQIVIAYIPAPQRAPPSSLPAEPAEDAADPTSDGAAQQTRELVIRPTSSGAFSNLVYDEWVADNRRYTEQKTAGRVGYCHVRSMGTPSFDVFERDLYAAAHGKDGLIIDVRNNGGGWTADWMLAVLSVRRHACTIPRGGTRGYPQDRLIFYSWTKPATMMCNQYSYSNAEIISHAFKNLGRGPLVGMTTFGAVISTGAYRLIDGAYVRMPFRGWYTLPDGVDMENHGAVPDILVPLTPQDEVAGRRPQLDAAIEATLEQLPPADE